jgi:hypothetical protein
MTNTKKRFTDIELGHLANLIAKSCGLVIDAVSLTENENGVFTLWIGSISMSGTLEEVLKFAADYTPQTKPKIKPV